jgi:hypothetical protein
MYNAVAHVYVQIYLSLNHMMQVPQYLNSGSKVRAIGA